MEWFYYFITYSPSLGIKTLIFHNYQKQGKGKKDYV